MDDRNRMRWAFACSAAAHLICALLLGISLNHSGPGPGPSPAPLVLNLQPAAKPAPEPDPVRRLVDPGTPTTTPVGATDLISTQASQASDLSPKEGDAGAPAVEQKAVYDSRGGPPPSPQTPPSTPPAQPAPPIKPTAAPPVATVASAPQELLTAQPVQPVNPTGAPPDSPTDVEPIQLAKASDGAAAQAAPPPPPAPTKVPGPSRGRVDGGVKNTGILSFEAMQHEMAPYLKDVQSRVEKRWRTTLHLKFSGTSPTEAVIDCAIAPSGKLAYIKIVDAGSSASYAPLCREAIEKAGPFSPFPFSVPEIYRSKNLEIRWTFSFL